jgi:gas vesicle protein
MDSGKVLLGLLVAVAAGATLGILFAPDKGSSTRKKISKKGDDYAGTLGHKFTELSEGISKKFDTMNEEAMRMLKNGKRQEEKVEEAIATGK